jgi:WD40 repeat protein
LNEGYIPNVRAARVEGNRRASRNSRVSDLPPDVTIRNLCSSRQGALSDLKYSPDNRYLAVAYMLAVDVLELGRDATGPTGVTYTPRSSCPGHSSVVKHVDWSSDGRLLMTNSQGYEILYYDASTGAQVVSDHRDQRWHTWSCVLGFPVMALFRSDMDGTDVNACHRSNSGALVVAADDDGCVRMLHYPAVVIDAGVLSYGGHSSHCVCVRFSSDDRWVVSVGSRDQTVIQWRVLHCAPPVTPPATHDGGHRDSSGESAQSSGSMAGLLERGSAATRYTKNRMEVLEQEMRRALAKQVEKKSRCAVGSPRARILHGSDTASGCGAHGGTHAQQQVVLRISY